MSRSGYTDYSDENWQLIRWRGAVNAAIRGKRGQSMLRDLATALDAMPEKKLITDKLEDNGCYCALGVLGAARGIPMERLDPEDSRFVAATFDIAEALAKEIVYVNDEEYDYSIGPNESPEQRWHRVRNWVNKQIKPTTD